ncbi:MAG: flagellar biosynthesis protein FlhF [Deltaproteobacteria bacterium HGW-Deltaproteobacteria-19]|nr:MAG: flagellar biosynthesis protein FlhF [Deltaproteobacteria bacterium HGW-Deltaproteobacteria-19]
MQMKRYEVSSLQEAMRRVKKDLGPEAIILSTKTLRDSNPPLLEVVAALDRKQDEVLPSSLCQQPPASSAHPGGDGMPDWARSISGELRELKGLLGNDRPDQLLREELSEVKEALFTLFDMLGFRQGSREQSPYGRLYHRLLANGVSRARALRIVDGVRQEGGDTEGDTYESSVRRAREAILRSFPQEAVSAEGKRVKALVGPTGVGKTTTLAKLAARFALEQKQKVGLITMDTYRIASVDQLQTYADIMKLPLLVAGDGEGFRESLRSFTDRDVILVDTPGRNPEDTEYLSELKRQFGESPDLEVSLLLTPAMNREGLQVTADRFRLLDYDSLILTKLDECQRFGVVFDILEQAGRPVRYVTCGQNVPQDIKEVTPGSLASLILGHSIH